MGTPPPRRVGLRRDEYNQHLLRIVRGKSNPHSSVVPEDPATSERTLPKRESSMDINAPPLSSSDEEDSTKPAQTVRVEKQPWNNTSDATSYKAVRSRNKRSARANGPGGSRLKNEEDLPTLEPTIKTESHPTDKMFDEWSQSQGKRRKPNNGYSGRNLPTGDGFRSVPNVPDLMEKDSPSSVFSVPDPSHRRRQKKITSSVKDDLLSLPPAVKSAPPIKGLGPSFNVPADIVTELTSSSISAADSLPTFDLPDSPKYSTSKRSYSSSSLSSVDSIASLILTQKEKNAMLLDESPKNDHNTPNARCPLCHSSVDTLHLEKFNFGRRLNIRDQQRFCQEHKVQDAERLGHEKQYPAIDWVLLENDRIPKHLPELRSILKRTMPSYYRDQLDVATQKAKASRKGLQHYLKEGVFEVVKHGYYGPKGARVIGHTITTHMAGELNKELKNDKLARTAGVGGYVNAVLVPELVMRLVIDDMNLKNELQARDVLNESSSMGILLNGDDEVVSREEDDEE